MADRSAGFGTGFDIQDQNRPFSRLLYYKSLMVKC